MRTTSSCGVPCDRSSTARRTTSARRRSAFSRSTSGGSDARDVDAFDELGDRALVDAVLAERREDVRDVVHEDRVRPDEEHAAERRAVGVQEIGGAVEPDGGLPRARAALDDERRLGARVRSGRTGRPGSLRRCRACGRHARARAPPAGSRRRGLAASASEPSSASSLIPVSVRPARAEAAAKRDAVRLGRRRRVERTRGRRLPVDDDARRRRRRPTGGRRRAESSAASRSRRPKQRPFSASSYERSRRIAQASIASAATSVAAAPAERSMRLAHVVEALVRVVDVGLLGRKVRVRHPASSR